VRGGATILSTMATEKFAFTVREAAQKIGCSRDTVYRMVHSGELPHFQHGPRGKIFIAVVEIEKLFRQRSLCSKVLADV
jgi:excisionase family DNA binding protein